MRAILVTGDNRMGFQTELQQELDGIVAAGGTIEDVKFSSTSSDTGTQWSALIISTEPVQAGISLGLAEEPIAETPPGEMIQVITPPQLGV
jgi:hypothetical protein